MSNPPNKTDNWTDDTAPKGVSPSHLQAWLDIVDRLRAEDKSHKEAIKDFDRYKAGMILVDVDEVWQKECWKTHLAAQGKEAQYEELKAKGELDDTTPLKKVYKHLQQKKSHELARIKANIAWLKAGKKMLEEDKELEAGFFKKDNGDNGESGSGDGAGAGIVH